MKKIILTLFFCLWAVFLFAQEGNHIWYFGNNAGLDFRLGEPTALLDGAMSTNEGCASISDDSGNLLFYTDGLSVWDKDHEVMPNGTGLLGSPSATQSSVVVPHPGNPNLYYIFTVPANEEDLSVGLNYSIVDMTLEGGLGNVTTKNVLLCTPITERVTSVIHQNGTDLWVITHLWNSDAFYAYLIDDTGLNPTPVISNVGSTHTDLLTNAAGYLKASINGDKLAIARLVLTASTPPSQFPSKIEIFDFDNGTGVVSNAIETPSTYFRVYGLEFSPDGNQLYFANNTATSVAPMEIYQMNLQAGSATDIINSATIIGTHPKSGTALFAGAMQLGRNGKIYVSIVGSDQLGVIENPNLSGVSASYVSNGVSLGGRIARFGLPNFIYSPASLGVPLNSSFIDFRGNIDSRQATLSWTFNNQATAQYFEIQRSNEGVLFETIGTKTAHEGLHTYTWQDLDLPHHAPWLYYKLLAVHQDKTLPSQPLGVENTAIGSPLAQIYPNPLPHRQALKIQLSKSVGSEVSITLWDSQGKMIYPPTSTPVPRNQIILLDIPPLPKGLYQLQIRGNLSKAILSEHLVVE